MTTTEIVLSLWLMGINAVCIWLCFERDRLHREIRDINRRLGAVLEKLR